MAETSATIQPPQEQQGQWLALIAIILGAFVAILNNSLINVALPKLVNTLSSTTDRMQWVLTGYMLASGVIIPISGYMGDRLGYKKFFTIALSIFTVGSALCATAWSDTSLIFFRIVAGLGGGVIMPLSMAIIYKIIPRHQIGMALGIWGISAMVAPAIGPTLSGYLIQYYSWRLLFIVSIPVSLLAILMVLLLLKETEIVKGKKFDFAGFFLSATSAGTLLYALSNGQKDGWTSFEIVSLLYISVSALVLLFYVETGKEDPIIDFSLFKNIQFTLSVLAGCLIMIGMYGGVFLTPIYLQNIQDMSTIDTGLLLMPQAIAMAIMMPIAGRLFDKIGAMPLALVGLTLLSIMTYQLHQLTTITSQNWLKYILMVRGIGIGLCMMPISTAGMNAVHPHQVAKASAQSNLIRQVAASFGIAILTMIMQDQTQLHAEQIRETVTLHSVAAQLFPTPAAMAQLTGIITLESLARGIADAFELSSIPLFLAIPIAFLFRRRKPHMPIQPNKQSAS
ncbi:DHA2 family efflux MFS transporter permease subunit [Fodinisporobacter ferrooxydans]|uniref:DHA2 family efflux MFS transporter permease subunit n=1 Tax=Fodinisporobacter ferrooxydans TaxID=2901836 RepID=A0ABY4CSE5_9BACL|nr:DHA2 family efflux MFS transporter permease subunit [Alicyclobacillaceae bacterium MYW30-H2]